jgi:hypothetical protein
MMDESVPENKKKNKTNKQKITTKTTRLQKTKQHRTLGGRLEKTGQPMNPEGKHPSRAGDL